MSFKNDNTLHVGVSTESEVCVAAALVFYVCKLTAEYGTKYFVAGIKLPPQHTCPLVFFFGFFLFCFFNHMDLDVCFNV